MDSNSKTYNILAYIGILFLVGMISAPNDQDVKFNVNQGLVLFIIEVAAGIISLIPIIGWIVGPIIGIGCFVLSIMGIMNVVNGLQKELPIIGKIKILK